MGTILGELAGDGIRGVPLVDRVGGSRWDLGVFYRPEHIGCRQDEAAIARSSGTVVKAAHSVSISAGTAEFRLYLLHWRSRLRGAADHRQEASIALRDSVRSDLEGDRAVVVMGDFNDEPFDGSLTILRASRDPRRVLRDRDAWLYNPSWSAVSPPHTDPWASFGSFAGRAGKTSDSYMFDQALTSAHFLDAATGAAPVVHVRRPQRTSPGVALSATMDHVPLELVLP